MRRQHPNIKDQLIYHEGERLMPYRCSAGKLTIGVGRNIDDRGISPDESALMLKNDIAACVADLVRLFGKITWESFSEGRRRALVDLRFNIGPERFRGFKKMIHAIRVGEWASAAEELKDSRWWGQVQEARRDTLYHQLYSGEP